MLAGRRVVAIACGHRHSVALTQGGELWTWGRGEHGRLGHGDDRDQPVPRRVVALSDRNVRAIACGGAHTVALVVPSAVYTWGLGRNGRLGTGDESDRNIPSPIVIDNQGTMTHAYRALMGSDVPRSARSGRIRAIACGWAFTLTLSASGRVRAFGAGSDGQCGSLPNEDRHTAVEVRGLRKIVSVACGYHHALAVDRHGALFAWGYGAQGQLGLGPREMVPEPARVGIGRTRASTPVPPTSPIVSPVSHIPPPCPSPASQPPPQSSPLWEDDGDERNGDGADAVSISHAACGQFHSLLLSSTGTVYAAGSNQHGELGLGHTRSTRVFEPMLKLPIHSRVRQLAAGQHFSLLMFRDANASSVGTTASQPNLELRSGRLFLWKSVPLARRIVQLGFGGAEWKSRYAVLSCASLQFFRDPTESQPEFTLPLGPELRVVARNGSSCGSSEAASSTATSVATSVSSASVEVADEELVQFSIWKLTPRVSSIANAAPEMSLVIRLKAKSERRRRKWVQALRRGIAAHRPNPRSRSMALAATGRKAATRDDNYAETWRTRILPEMRKGGVYPAKEVSSQELLRRGIPK